jgi:hypothetical protein
MVCRSSFQAARSFHRDDPADSLQLDVKGGFVILVMTPLGE